MDIKNTVGKGRLAETTFINHVLKERGGARVGESENVTTLPSPVLNESLALIALSANQQTPNISFNHNCTIMATRRATAVSQPIIPVSSVE
jgi:hypothetical protein